MKKKKKKKSKRKLDTKYREMQLRDWTGTLDNNLKNIVELLERGSAEGEGGGGGGGCIEAEGINLQDGGVR